MTKLAPSTAYLFSNLQKQLRKIYTFRSDSDLGFRLTIFSKQNLNISNTYCLINSTETYQLQSVLQNCNNGGHKKKFGIFCTTFFVLFTGTVARPQLLIILVEVVCKIQMVCVCVQHMGKSCTEYLNKPTQYMYLLTFLAAVLNCFQFYPIVLATK